LESAFWLLDDKVNSINDVLFANLDLNKNKNKKERNITSIVDMERQLIIDTLEKCQNNKHKAAELFGISERTLYRKIKKNNLLY
jgi:DNA-binding NtrC family response regulator